MRRSVFAGVGKYPLRIGAAVQDERRFVENASHEYLKTADVKHRKRRLPEALAMAVEHRIR